MQTTKTGVTPHVQTATIYLFTFRKCGILRKSQAKGCVTMETPNITTPLRSTITQVTLQIPNGRANHRTTLTFMY